MKGEVDKNRDGSITDKELCSYVTKNMEEEIGDRQTSVCSNLSGLTLGRYK